MITEVCGAKRLGHFGRPQFYLAMKLIGAAQAGLPVKLDIVSSGQPTQLPPPPSAKSHNKTSRQSSLKDLETSPQHQPFSQAAPNYTFVPPPPRGSRDSSPDGQTSDKTWTRFHQPGERQLNWSHFEEHRQLLGNEEDSSDRHSSDEEHDIWSIADDQRDYYTNQFQAMQPDLRGKITGAIAKEFFEKSKLPVHELSKIWQLSDIDKDGALSIEEFRTAMHLVVLRRNSIELPEVLPPSLVPKLPQKPVDGSSATLPMVPQQTLAYVVTTEVSGDVAANSFSGAVAGAPTLAGSQGQLSLPQGPKKEPPPPPPPRPKRNHARSSSLDLNRLGKSNPQNLGAPPAVPPRVSPGNVSKSITGDVPSGMDFADFDHFAESRSDVATGPPSQHQFQPGAFEVYKKPTSAEELAASPFLSGSSYSDDEESSPAPTDDSAMLLVDQTDGSAEKKKHRTAPLAMAATEMKTIPNEKWELHQAVRAHRERNNMLVLLNSELNQELMEATEERLSLEIQLENLKPFSC
ncbi:partner of ralbp-1, putative [Ixodes scapularis]|uniref:Partner of ralbp-1, putative n=1 Tax=Ixodes scapularis TaxID=6945 RepID=B7P2S6_IXOSC|nr:partner of ralbp-1, putative [Ixodes scapularis]|eukprot:XP_002402967.1 partner of ralbp-1, putative [Ixodes scapularis]